MSSARLQKYSETFDFQTVCDCDTSGSVKVMLNFQIPFITVHSEREFTNKRLTNFLLFNQFLLFVIEGKGLVTIKQFSNVSKYL